MSRFIDFILVMVGLFGILIVQTSGAVMLEELRVEFNDDAATGNINQQNINNEMHTAVTKWVPTVAFAGLWILAGFREYRRQRVTAMRRRRI